MRIATLIPAYGRDYTSKAKVMADYNANKDFILQDLMSPWDGKAINKHDVENSEYTTVHFRYDKLRKIHVIKK